MPSRVRKPPLKRQQHAPLRPITIWVLDAREPGFAEECLRQSRVVASADAADTELLEFLDATHEDAAWDAH
jgi:hypothetical protein